MDFHRITIYTGNYGSGKTEISLNTVIQLSQKGRTTLVDLDIVNPYFRSSEKAVMLEKMGIKVIRPSFAETAIDIPAVGAEVTSVFSDREAQVVFDVGGDPVGATALGRYKENFLNQDYAMYCVVNARRPLSSTPEDITEMLQKIESRSRLKATAFIHNSNLGRETNLSDLVECAPTVRAASKLAGIPIAFTCGKKEILDAFKPYMSLEDGEPFQIVPYMRPEWME